MGESRRGRRTQMAMACMLVTMSVLGVSWFVNNLPAIQANVIAVNVRINELKSTWMTSWTLFVILNFLVVVIAASSGLLSITAESRELESIKGFTTYIDSLPQSDLNQYETYASDSIEEHYETGETYTYSDGVRNSSYDPFQEVVETPVSFSNEGVLRSRYDPFQKVDETHMRYALYQRSFSEPIDYRGFDEARHSPKPMELTVLTVEPERLSSESEEQIIMENEPPSCPSERAPDKVIDDDVITIHSFESGETRGADGEVKSPPSSELPTSAVMASSVNANNPPVQALNAGFLAQHPEPAVGVDHADQERQREFKSANVLPIESTSGILTESGSPSPAQVSSVSSVSAVSPKGMQSFPAEKIVPAKVVTPPSSAATSPVKVLSSHHSRAVSPLEGTSPSPSPDRQDSSPISTDEQKRVTDQVTKAPKVHQHQTDATKPLEPLSKEDTKDLDRQDSNLENHDDLHQQIETFLANFHEQMRLQRQESNLRHQKLLNFDI